MTVRTETIRYIVVLCMMLFLIVPLFALAVTTEFSVQITPTPECSDMGDNDGDGFIDFPADPDCDSATDTIESGAAGTALSSGSSNQSTSAVRSSRESSDSASGSEPEVDEDPSYSFVRIQGRTYPGGRLLIIENGSIIAETTAQSDGSWMHVLERQELGRQQYQVISTDSNGNRSAPIIIPVRITPGITMDIDVVNPSPTTSIINDNEGFRISGFAQPQSLVEIISPVGDSTIVRAKSDGAYHLNPDVVQIGQYIVRSITAEGAVISFSKVVVIPKVDGFDSGVVVQGTDDPLDDRFLNNPRYTTESLTCRGDLNDDRRVDVADFVIAKIWYEKPLSQAMTRREADCLSGDGVISITDMSIIAYNWSVDL